jgi:hypothetical protein
LLEDSATFFKMNILVVCYCLLTEIFIILQRNELRLGKNYSSVFTFE